MRDLRGKTAFITGGGIGFGMARAFAGELWVLTHPDLEPFVAERDESILVAFKQEPDPERVAAIRARAAAARTANAG